VLSDSTRRVDLSEKKDAYLSIPSLALYVVCQTATCAVQVWRRTDEGFVQENWQQLEAVIPLPELGGQLALADLYEGVAWAEKR